MGLELKNPFQSKSRVNFQFWRQPVYELADGTLWHPGSDGPTYLVNVDSPWSYVAIGLPGSLGLTGKPVTDPYTPGKATVHVTKFRDVDKKKAAGNDGGRVTIHGVEPCQVDIEIYIWTPDQLQALATLWPTLFPQAYKGTPPAFDVQHPLLTIHGVKALQFVKGEGPELDGKGGGTFKMSAWEFLKPKGKATKTEVQAIGSLFDAGAVKTSSSGYALPGSDASNLGPK